MSLVIDVNPSAVSFAGNPIVIKAHTTLTKKTFLRIIADVSVMATNVNGGYAYKESYTYSVADDGWAVFNIAETIQTALRSRTDLVNSNGQISQRPAKATYSVVLKEVYLDNMIEITGDVNNTLANLVAVMGGLSDYELYLHPSWTASQFIGSGAVLSRKPDNEVVYGSHPVLLPVIAGADQTMTVSDKLIPSGTGATTAASAAVTAYRPLSVSVSTDSMAEGLHELSLSPAARTFTTHKFIRHSAAEDHVSFLFLNGFGLLESITALTRRAKSYRLKNEHYIEGKSVGQVVAEAMNIAQQPELEFQLTSGLTDSAWADWWTTEFLPSRKVWMLMGALYVPVLIDSDDTVKQYDTSKPDLCEIKFSVRSTLGGSSVSVVR